MLIAKCIANGFILFPENVKGSYEIQRNSKPEKDALVPLPKDGDRTDDNQKRPSSSEPNVLIPYLRHSFNRIDFIAIIFYWIDVVLMIRRKFLKIYRYEQELNKGIKHSSEITSVGIAGINSTLSQEIEKLRSLLPNYIPEASLATLMKKLPKSPELSFDSTLKNLNSILESMKVTEEVPKPYNR
ncbi:hypothetical protein BGZ46_005363 [Entomortierella lignicola]|nr:hypothetical protein BGZ46_005363 [Entomortierella lignicola]